MKSIYKIFTVAVLAGTVSLTSCIEDAIQSNSVTEDIVKASPNAGEAMVWAMPAYFINFATYSSSYHYDWGYGSIMHVRDLMTADVLRPSVGYNWYTQWSSNSYLGKRYVVAAFVWNYYYNAINTTKQTFNSLEGVTEGPNAGYLGAAHAFRALFYLDLARMYEFLPNDIYGADYVTTEETAEEGEESTVGKSINYLTVPIVTNETTEDEQKNNPRATHEEMYDFILSDLTQAEELIPNLSRSVKTLPDLACVKGLQARLYMWNAGYLEETGKAEEARAEYAKAEAAARAAIDLGGNVPLSKEEWLNTTTGFNSMTSNSWMWAANATANDDVVKSGILNWTSWMSNEATFGYAAAGAFLEIGSALYNSINDADFRKLSFLAPEDGALAGQEPMIINNPSDENYVREILPDYASLKFRPGNAIVDDATGGASCDHPIMRVEEMYLIEAEAAAHQNASRGIQLINNFMKNYRYAGYNCTASSQEAVIDEIFQQKRIELWGEGQIFFDYKRLNKSVDRTTSTNWDPTENFKTNGRPAWMNFVIINSEENNNKGVRGYNNPDPSDAYTPVVR